MMAEPGQRRRNLRWAVSIAVLLVLIDFFLSRPLEGLWDSLQERNSPAYLPLEWWMSAPFTLFMFAILSAILTSFSGLRNWFKAFLLLCGFKLIFAAASAASFHFRGDTGLVEAAVQAMFLLLPFVLVHIVLSGLAAMSFGDSFAEGAGEEVLATPYFTGAEVEEPLDVETASEAEIILNRIELQSGGKPKSPKNKFHFSNYWELELQTGDTRKYDLGRIKLAIKRNLLPNKFTVNKDSKSTGLLVFQGRLPRYGEFTLFVPVFKKNGEMIHNFRYNFTL